MSSSASLSADFLSHKKLPGIAFLWFLIFAAQGALSQNFSVIYNFSGGNDGANPAAGVTLDRTGNLYGTTSAGGSSNCVNNGIPGCGTVFKLSHQGTGWVLAPLHVFNGPLDGKIPLARVVFGPNGSLFGTTVQGGMLDYGTVFELKPPGTACSSVVCPWVETQPYSFGVFGSGGYPGAGDLSFDAQGNIYGTIESGGSYLCDDQDCGGAFVLLTNGHGGWTYQATFFGGGISYSPTAGLVRDPSGNFYGVTPHQPGGIFQYLNNQIFDLYYFTGNLTDAVGGLISDSAGALYGTTAMGGTAGGGIVFKFVTFDSHLTVLYNLAGTNEFAGGSTATLLMDSLGNLYGITHLDGAYNQGSVFKLSQSNGVWTLTTLHDFTGGADGGEPFGQLTMDSSGNIYGTTEFGGSTVGSCYGGMGCGVVFQIAP